MTTQASTDSYASWLMRKRLYESSKVMLAKISTDRASDADAWAEVGRTCAAIDLAGGAADIHGIWEGKDLEEALQNWATTKASDVGKKRSFQDFWTTSSNPKFVSLGPTFLRWTKQHHFFTGVHVSQTYAQKMSAYMRELMEENSDGSWNLSSLKYTFPNKTARNSTAKALSEDERLKNRLFSKLARAAWKKCCIEVTALALEKIDFVPSARSDYDDRAPSKIAAATKSGGEDGSSSDDDEDDNDETKRASSAHRPSPATDAGAVSTESATAQRRRVLSALGVRKLARWVEADEEERVAQDRRKREERSSTSRRMHKKWVQKKNRLRIRLPSRGIETVKQKPQRFDFSKRGVARGQIRGNTVKATTVDLLGNLGLKYVHATGRRAENNRDLIESRAQLAKAGVVLKENFVDEDGDVVEDVFKERLRESSKIAERSKPSREGAQHRAWLRAKRRQEKAMTYLEAIVRPADATEGSFATALLREAGDADGDGTLSPEERWITVGKALKAVHPGLMSAWIKWSDGFRSAYVCAGYWNAFSPIACDVHAVGSVVRDTMLKLMRRRRDGTDLREIFEAAYRDVRARDARKQDTDLDEDAVSDEIASMRASLSLRDFKRMVRKRLGFNLTEAELRRISRSLDANGDGSVSLKEWTHFTDASLSTHERLSKRCLWEEACHVCGMPHAYALKSTSSPTASSMTRREAKLAEGSDDDDDFENDDDDDETRCVIVPPRTETEDFRRLLRTIPFVRDLHQNASSSLPPRRCEASRWDEARSDTAMRRLHGMARRRLERTSAAKKKSRGSKPLAPTLSIVRFADDKPKNLTSSLRLRWDASEGSDPVAFFVLETCGREGSQSQLRQQWRTICVDPPNASTGDDPTCEYVMTGLRPDASYHFRLRALNGHGASGYVHGVFATAPASPPAPFVARANVRSIELCWSNASDRTFAERLGRLRSLFRRIDVDGSGTVSREELRRALRDKANADLRKMVTETPAAPSAVRARLSLSQRLELDASSKRSDANEDVSVFDMIERNDDNDLDWDEFVQFFGKRAVAIVSSSSSSVVVSTGTKSVVQTCVATAVSHGPQLQEDVDDEGSAWKDVYVGADTSCVVKNLSPGRRYRFRVLYVNSDGVESAPSASVVATCLLPAPPAPKLAGRAIETLADTVARVQLAAGAASEVLVPHRFRCKGSGEGDAESMLKQWALSSSALRADREGGVNVRAIFDSFDEDGSGSIDSKELEHLLKALDAPHDKVAVRRAMAQLDTDRSGQISPEEFYAWFESSTATFILKRDDGILCRPSSIDGTRDERVARIRRADPSSSARTNGKGAYTLPPPVGGASRVVSRTDLRIDARNVGNASIATLVRDLRPNTLYRLWTRVVSNQSSSPLSAPLALLTAPERLRAPVAAAVGARWMRLRIYPTSTGAFSYVIEVQSRDGGKISTARRSSASSSSSWTVAWEGRSALAECQGLSPASTYRVRVIPLNCWGGKGTPSPHVVVRTTKSAKREVTPTSKNAVDLFRIECTSDVVVGDTILFTEKVFAASSDLHEPSKRKGRRNASSSKQTERQTTTCIGEQTVCALVTQDKWVKPRSPSARQRRGHNSRRRGRRRNEPLDEIVEESEKDVAAGERGHARDRALCLRVLWSTGSTPVVARQLSSPNVLLWRKEKSLCHYEMHRLEWTDESARLSYAKQWQEVFEGEDASNDDDDDDDSEAEGPLVPVE